MAIITGSGGSSGVNPQFSVDQLFCERNVLSSLIYKMNNAHGRLPYFGSLRKLQRDLDALLGASGSDEDSCTVGTWSVVLERAQADMASGQYAKSMIAALETLAQDAMAAAAPMRELLSRGHWLPFGLSVVGCTARIVVIAENLIILLQPYARATKRSSEVTTCAVNAADALVDEEDMGVAVDDPGEAKMAVECSVVMAVLVAEGDSHPVGPKELVEFGRRSDLVIENRQKKPRVAKSKSEQPVVKTEPAAVRPAAQPALGDPVGSVEEGRLQRLSLACSKQLGMLPRLHEVRRAVELFEADGCTLPFVARYRRGYVGLPEGDILKLHKYLMRERTVEEKRIKCVKTLASRAVLDQQLLRYLCSADCRAEDIADIMASLAPQTKRKTKAQEAIDAGFGPMADLLLEAAREPCQHCPLNVQRLLNRTGVGTPWNEGDVEAAITAILCHRITRGQEARSLCRVMVEGRAKLEVEGIPENRSSSQKKPKGHSSKRNSQMDGYARNLNKVKPHEWLAIKRGEASKQLRVKIAFPNTKALIDANQKRFLAHGHSSCLCAGVISAAVRKAVDSIEKSLSRELRSERLTTPAEEFAIKTFTDNVSVKLMCPPFPVETGTAVIGVDPGYVNGNKCVVITATGEVVDEFKFWSSSKRMQAGPDELARRVYQWSVKLVVVGDGQGSQEATDAIRQALDPTYNVGICIVDECGASIYSAGDVAASELPGMDISLRGAVSIARRVLDPIAEFVKLEPKHIGVGLFQHDMPPKQLETALTQAVQWCVCQVGVDVNTASVSLLKYVAGLNATTAKRIVDYRTQQGKLGCREEMKKVKGIGPAVFQQAAGFIRVYEGSEPLDATGIHPESYECARQLKDIINRHRGEGEHGARAVEVSIMVITDVNSLLQHFSPRDDSEQARTSAAEVLTELLEANRDVRLEHPERYRPREIEYPPYKASASAALEVGAHLEGSIENVVSFGAFVHLYCEEPATGLLHVSSLPPAVTLDTLSVNQRMADTSDLLDELLEEALTPPSGTLFSPRQPLVSGNAPEQQGGSHPHGLSASRTLPPLPLQEAPTIMDLSDDLDLLTPVAKGKDEDFVVPFTAADSSLESSAEALPTVPAPTASPTSAERMASESDAVLGGRDGLKDLWPTDSEDGKDTPSLNDSRSDQPPSVMELAGPLTDENSPPNDAFDATGHSLAASVPPLGLAGSTLPPIQEVSTGRASSGSVTDSARRNVAGLAPLAAEQQALRVTVNESKLVPELPPLDLRPVRFWLEKMERARPQSSAITDARTGGLNPIQLDNAQSALGHRPTILYTIRVGRVLAPTVPGPVAKGVLVSYRVYVTLFHLRSQLIISRTAVGPKVEAPAGHDFDMAAEFFFHTGTSLVDPQIGMVFELALTSPEGDRLSGGWTVVPAGHQVNGGALLLNGTPRLLPFIKREVIGAFATTQTPTEMLIGLATGGRIEVAFRQISAEDPEGQFYRGMLPPGYVASLGAPVGCLNAGVARRAEIAVGGVRVDIESHHLANELQDAIRFAGEDFRQRFKSSASRHQGEAELSNLCTVVLYAHNGLHPISPEYAFHLQADSMGNPVLVSATQHTIDMVLHDDCAIAVELHYHLAGEGSINVPVCLGWCLLLLSHLDPVTECMIAAEPRHSALLRCRLLKGPGVTLAGRRVWIGSPTGTNLSIELTVTGEAYITWLRGRQEALHADRVRDAVEMPTRQPPPVVEKLEEPTAVLPPPVLPGPPIVTYQPSITEPVVEVPGFPTSTVLLETMQPGTPPPPPAVDPFSPMESALPVDVGALAAPPPTAMQAEFIPRTPPPTVPASQPIASLGGVVIERETQRVVVRDVDTQYEMTMTDPIESEIIPVRETVTLVSSPSAGVELSTQGGRQPESPQPRSMSPADKASAVAARLVTASTAEQESLTSIDWRLEENDPLLHDEITMALVGWRPSEAVQRPGSKRVYFTAKLYTFSVRTTEVAEMSRNACHSVLSSTEGHRLSTRWCCCFPSRLAMLQRVASHEGHGIELEMHCADTGMLIATASVPLHGLPRQQRMVSRLEEEVPCCSLAASQGAVSVLGWLQVIIENRGVRDCGQTGHKHSPLVSSSSGGYVRAREAGVHGTSAPHSKNVRVKAPRLPWPDELKNSKQDAAKYFGDQRERSRPELVQRKMREALVERRYLPAISGEARYFTVPFGNPLQTESLFAVRFGRVGSDGSVVVEPPRHSGLSLVSDPVEWRYVITTRGLPEPDCGYELFTATAEFLLQPSQSVDLPFRYFPLVESAEDLSFEISIRRSGGDIVRVIELVVPGPVGFLPDQVTRLWEPERTPVRATLKLDRDIGPDALCMVVPEDSGIAVARCSSSSYLEVSLTSPPFNEKPCEAVCLVYPRGDKYNERPTLALKIICIGLLSEYVKGAVGRQIDKVLQLPSHLTLGASTILAYTSNEALARIEPPRIAIHESAPGQIPIIVTPSRSGASSCLVYASKLDQAAVPARLLASWILDVQAEPPTVTETHELTLPYGRRCRKRLPFRNPITRHTEFAVRSSNTEVMQVVSSSMGLAPLAASHIDLVFPAAQGYIAKKAECFLFISSTDGQNRRASSTHEASKRHLARRATTGGYPSKRVSTSDPPLVPNWPGPPNPKQSTVPSAASRGSLERRRRSMVDPREAHVRLELVLEKLPKMRTSHTCIEDSIHTALTSAARLPVECLRVSKFHWDPLGRPTLDILVRRSEELAASDAVERIVAALDNTRSPFRTSGSAQRGLLAGAFLRRPTRQNGGSQGPDTAPLRIVVSPSFETSLSTSEIGEIIRIGLLRATRLPPNSFNIEKCSRQQDGQLLLSLVACGQGRLNANDVTAKLIASVDDTSSSVHKGSSLLSAILANARLEVGTRRASLPDSNSRGRSLSTRRPRARSRTPSRRPSVPPRCLSQPRRKNKVSVPSGRKTVDEISKLIPLHPSSFPDSIAEELKAWGKNSMADLLRGVTTTSEASRTGDGYSVRSSRASESLSLNDAPNDSDRLVGRARRSHVRELTPKFSPGGSSQVPRTTAREGHRDQRTYKERGRSGGVNDQLQLVDDTSIEELPVFRATVSSCDRKTKTVGPEATERDFLDEIQDELLVLRTSLHPSQPPQETRTSTESSIVEPRPYARYSASSPACIEVNLVDKHVPAKPSGSQAFHDSNTLRRRSYGEVRKEAARANRNAPTATSPVFEPEWLTKLALPDDKHVLEPQEDISAPTDYLGQSDPSNDSSRHSEPAEKSAYQSGTSSGSSTVSVSANTEISSGASRPSELSRRTSSTSVVSAARKSQIIDMVLKGLPRSQQTIVAGSDVRRAIDRGPLREFDAKPKLSTTSGVDRTHLQEVAAIDLHLNHPASRKQISSTSSSDSRVSPDGSSSVYPGEDAESMPPSRPPGFSSELRRVNISGTGHTPSSVPSHDAKSVDSPVANVHSMPVAVPTGKSLYCGILDGPIPSQPAAVEQATGCQAMKPSGGSLSGYRTSEGEQQPLSSEYSWEKELSPAPLPLHGMTEPSRPELPPPSPPSALTGSYARGSPRVGTATCERRTSDLPSTAFSAPVIKSDSELPVFRDPSWLMSPRGSTINIAGQAATSVDDQGDGADSWAVGAIDPYSLRDGSKAWQCVVRSLRRGIPDTVAQVGLGIGLCSDPIGVLDCNLVTDLPSAVVLGYDCSAVFANDDWCDVTQGISEHWACNLRVGDVLSLVLTREALHVLVNWQNVQSQAIGSSGLTDPHLVIDLVGTVDSVPVSYTKKDVILYALGVGASELKYVYEHNDEFSPLPSMPFALSFKGAESADILPFPPPHFSSSSGGIPPKGPVLDGERSLTLLKPLPTSAQNWAMKSRITAVSQKRSGVVVESETIISDKTSGEEYMATALYLHVIDQFAEGDASRVKGIRCRFSKPVLMGEKITTKMWRADANKIVFKTCKHVSGKEITCLDGGVIELFTKEQSKM
ncbi:hypothetical protein FOL47_009310 [Perkinsus chesapeaki]|uniref:YqgF/RNase H-like domain-containing protein n=1 Tax=Perkinsus chesapeaki TaxID=330153 RepID=A0A7J6MU24_PERCH|nr:hypothetical protein FOL47_009310 [Perkinsus chesapeaki]